MTLGEVAVIPLGQFSAGSGEALVCGPESQFGGSANDAILSASFAGSIIVLGRASEIPLINLPEVDDMSTQALLKQLPAIVGEHGGNIFNGPQDNLIGADGETLKGQ